MSRRPIGGRPKFHLSIGPYIVTVEFHSTLKGLSMNTRLFAPRHLVLALVGAGVIGLAATGAYNHGLATAAPAPANTTAVQAIPTAAPATVTVAAPGVALPDFAQLAARNGPAVVNISVTGVSKAGPDQGEEGSRGAPGMDPNDPYFEFFRRFQGPNGGQPGERADAHRGARARASSSAPTASS